VYILDGHLVREGEIQVILDEGGVLGASKRCQADLLAINRIGADVLLLDRVIFLLAALRDHDTENGRTQIGVHCALILARLPELEAPLGLGDSANTS
jgi:hypothetical protein